MTRIPTISGDERDAFTRVSRRLLYWRPGELRRIKRGYWKRFRKAGKALEMAGDR
ncbi:hypothetical protein [Roseomonas indoligenes]|uniref:Uncharacterized protein n=1 Tax=Roseomonas indoligenes TaxID=2820811 RepID=A0A940MVT1_9PROT|nr:hypothetical protein [Pararoseomonas indoligenes]MBP0492137.1 hypothetical protein [Pararoseomonas indoligenes]